MGAGSLKSKISEAPSLLGRAGATTLPPNFTEVSMLRWASSGGRWVVCFDTAAEGCSLTSLLREFCLRRSPAFVGEVPVVALRDVICFVDGDFEPEGRTVLFEDEVEDSRTGASRSASSFDALLALRDGRRFCGLGIIVFAAG
jgi:hypothetical protein